MIGHGHRQEVFILKEQDPALHPPAPITKMPGRRHGVKTRVRLLPGGKKVVERVRNLKNEHARKRGLAALTERRNAISRAARKRNRDHD